MRSGFYISLIFLFFYSFMGIAQSTHEDVVYLKNGGVTRGTILEIIPDTLVKIQTKDRNIFVYKFNEIEKILKEPIPGAAVASPKGTVKDSGQEEKNSKGEYKQQGFHNITKFGPLGFNSYNINVINGYQFNPYFLLGLGVGLDTYKGLDGYTTLLVPDGNNQSTTDYFLPIYLDVRYHVSQSKATFFVFFNMGYSVFLGSTVGQSTTTTNYNNQNYSYKTTRGGTFICPGIGFKVFLSKKVGIVVDFGTKFQNYSSYSIYSSNPNNRIPGLVIGPVLNFGIAF